MPQRNALYFLHCSDNVMAEVRANVNDGPEFDLLQFRLDLNSATA
jgi:hypothetical protein